MFRELLLQQFPNQECKTRIVRRDDNSYFVSTRIIQSGESIKFEEYDILKLVEIIKVFKEIP